jgi:hypothetical protein
MSVRPFVEVFPESTTTTANSKRCLNTVKESCDMPRREVVLGRRQELSLGRRLKRNRYQPESQWLSVQDLWLNIKEELYCWWHRVPPGAVIKRKGGRIVSVDIRRD